MLTSKFNNYTINLVQTVEDFNFMKSQYNENVVVGLDTETSGLDYNKDDIAGYCISLGKSLSVKDYQGYYIPVRHIGYNDNLPLDIVVDFVQHLLDTGKVMFFNRPFDATMLEKDGITMPFVGKTHDVQIMAHLVTGESFPALKPSVKKYLKFDVIDFSENNAKDHNFKTTDPRVSYVYAANDPLITVLLGQRLWVDFPYIHKIYPIDNKASEAMRRFSNDTLLYLDKEIIMREHEKVTSALAEVKNKIFSFVGYEFKLNSPRDKADALSRYVTLTQKTKGGQFEVGKEVLQKIDHPLAKMLLEYAKLEKYRGSYVAKMLDFPSDGFHINYSTCNVSTGRMSSGSSKGNEYFANFNIQNVPKTEVFRTVWRDDDLGYAINDRETISVEGDGEEKELYELALENGSVVRVDGDATVKIERNGKIQYSQVKNLTDTDVLLES